MLKKESNLGYLLILAAGALWGTIGLFSTIMAREGMPAGQVAFYRTLASATMLFLVLLVKGRGFGLFKISRRGLMSCLLVGTVSQAMFNYCYMNTIALSDMATGAVFLYTSPIYVAILSRVFFKEALTANKILAIFINIAGCIMTVTGGQFSSIKISGLALIMGIMSGFTYALLPVLSRTGADKEHPYTAAFYGQLFGAVLLLFIIRPWNTEVVFNATLILAILGLGIVPSAMAYIAYYGGLSRMKETSKVPVLASVETVVAALIGLIAFGQGLGIAKCLGILLVLISIIVMNMKAKQSTFLIKD